MTERIVCDDDGEPNVELTALRAEFTELQARYDRLLGLAKHNLRLDREAEIAATEARSFEWAGQDERIAAMLRSKESLVRSMRTELAFRRLLDSLPAPHEGDGSLLDPKVIAEEKRNLAEGVREIEEAAEDPA